MQMQTIIKIKSKKRRKKSARIKKIAKKRPPSSHPYRRLLPPRTQDRVRSMANTCMCTSRSYFLHLRRMLWIIRAEYFGLCAKKPPRTLKFPILPQNKIKN